MYCPVCFNDTLKIASSGVVKVTFDGKSKSTSQFYYNLKQDTDEEILTKAREVITDYFTWYATFQNKDPIRNVEMTSCDFKCSTGCKLNISHRLNIIGLIFTAEEVKNLIQEEASKQNLQLDLKLQR